MALAAPSNPPGEVGALANFDNTACTQDTLVYAKEDGASTASARVSFEVDFRWHATEMCMVGPGSAARVDRMKVHGRMTYNEW